MNEDDIQNQIQLSFNCMFAERGNLPTREALNDRLSLDRSVLVRFERDWGPALC